MGPYHVVLCKVSDCWVNKVGAPSQDQNSCAAVCSKDNILPMMISWKQRDGKGHPTPFHDALDIRFIKRQLTAFSTINQRSSWLENQKWIVHADNRTWNAPLIHDSFVPTGEEAILQIQLNTSMQELFTRCNLCILPLLMRMPFLASEQNSIYSVWFVYKLLKNDKLSSDEQIVAQTSASNQNTCWTKIWAHHITVKVAVLL